MIAESRARFFDFSIKGKGLWFYFFHRQNVGSSHSQIN